MTWLLWTQFILTSPKICIHVDRNMCKAVQSIYLEFGNNQISLITTPKVLNNYLNRSRERKPYSKSFRLLTYDCTNIEIRLVSKSFSIFTPISCILLSIFQATAHFNRWKSAIVILGSLIEGVIEQYRRLI